MAAAADGVEKENVNTEPKTRKERVYDTVALSEMEYDEDDATYYYQCPCGDMFEISKADLDAGERIAKCPSCSLRLKVTVEELTDAINSDDTKT